MNYLAHLHSGGPQPTQLLGSLHGDFVKDRLQGQWPNEIKRIVQLHRCIDTFTDSHSLVHAAKRYFPLEHRRFVGVLLDMFFSHCPARGWNDYAGGPLSQFVERVYGTLRTALPLPERLTRIAPRTTAQDWLGSYRESAVLREVLGDVSRRLSRPRLLDSSWEELTRRYDDLSADSRAFYLQLQTFALSQCWVWRSGH